MKYFWNILGDFFFLFVLNEIRKTKEIFEGIIEVILKEILVPQDLWNFFFVEIIRMNRNLHITTRWKVEYAKDLFVLVKENSVTLFLCISCGYSEVFFLDNEIDVQQLQPLAFSLPPSSSVVRRKFKRIELFDRRVGRTYRRNLAGFFVLHIYLISQGKVSSPTIFWYIICKSAVFLRIFLCYRWFSWFLSTNNSCKSIAIFKGSLKKLPELYVTNLPLQVIQCVCCWFWCEFVSATNGAQLPRSSFIWVSWAISRHCCILWIWNEVGWWWCGWGGGS